jgi:hypothetical protein
MTSTAHTTRAHPEGYTGADHQFPECPLVERRGDYALPEEGAAVVHLGTPAVVAHVMRFESRRLAVEFFRTLSYF